MDTYILYSDAVKTRVRTTGTRSPDYVHSNWNPDQWANSLRRTEMASAWADTSYRGKADLNQIYVYV